MDRVSIVTPVYNGAAYLAATLDSARAQTYPDLELIVIDDGSTDGSYQIAAGRADRCERLDHIGAGHARNRGLELATGRWVLFLDADDLISPDFVAAMVAALDGAAPRSFAVGRYQWLRQRKGAWVTG